MNPTPPLTESLISLRFTVPAGHRIFATLPHIEYMQAALLGNLKRLQIAARTQLRTGSLESGTIIFNVQDMATAVKELQTHLGYCELLPVVEICTIQFINNSFAVNLVPLIASPVI